MHPVDYEYIQWDVRRVESKIIKDSIENTLRRFALISTYVEAVSSDISSQTHSSASEWIIQLSWKGNKPFNHWRIAKFEWNYRRNAEIKLVIDLVGQFVFHNHFHDWVRPGSDICASEKTASRNTYWNLPYLLPTFVSVHQLSKPIQQLK